MRFRAKINEKLETKATANAVTEKPKTVTMLVLFNHHRSISGISHRKGGRMEANKNRR
jgi:hypothetical protein